MAHRDSGPSLANLSSVPSGSILFHLPPAQNGVADRGGPGPPPRQNMCVILPSAPSRAALASPLIHIHPRQNSSARFLPFAPLRRRGFSRSVVHYGQGRKAPRSLLDMDRGHQPEVLGYWIKGLPKWATAVSKSALIPRKLSINKPGPRQGYSLEGAPSNY